MSDNARLAPMAQVPAFTCPEGTKMHILDLGRLEVDEGWSVANCDGLASAKADIRV